MMTTESLGMYGQQLKLSLEAEGGVAVKEFPGSHSLLGVLMALVEGIPEDRIW